MSLFCCDFFRTFNYIISDIFRMSSIFFAFFSELERKAFTMGMKERVKMLCKERDMSLNKAEADCGFAKGYFSKLDKSKPNSANLQKIAEFFNVSIKYLIDGKDKAYSEEDALLDAHISEDVELKEAIKKYYTLDEKARKYILDGIDLLWRANKTDTK